MRSEQRIGRAGQNVAAATLSRIGIEMVEEIGTPVKLIPASAICRLKLRSNSFKW